MLLNKSTILVLVLPAGADIIYDKSVIPELLALLALLLEGRDGRDEGPSCESLLSSLGCEEGHQEELDAVLRPPFALLASVVRDKSTQDGFVAQARALGLNIVVAPFLSRTHHFSFVQFEACDPINLYILKGS